MSFDPRRPNAAPLYVLALTVLYKLLEAAATSAGAWWLASQVLAEPTAAYIAGAILMGALWIRFAKALP